MLATLAGRRVSTIRTAAAVLLAIIGVMRPVLGAEDGSVTACERAGEEAERKSGLPVGLLHAIGLVESGRRDPATGRVAPWPWTINANGAGQMFPGPAEALAAARAILGRGVASVDVGCFQINLYHHPAAFNSLEEAFDPQANAAYAARFLATLYAKTGSWENAVADYHSATAELGAPYRDRVMASLLPSGPSPAGSASPVNPARVWRVIRWTAAPVGERMKIWKPSAAGQAPVMIVINNTNPE